MLSGVMCAAVGCVMVFGVLRPLAESASVGQPSSERFDIRQVNDPLTLYSRAKDSADISTFWLVERAVLSILHIQRVYRFPLANWLTGNIHGRQCPKLTGYDFNLFLYVALLNRLDDDVLAWIEQSRRSLDQTQARSQESVTNTRRKAFWIDVFRKKVSRQTLDIRLNTSPDTSLILSPDTRMDTRVDANGQSASDGASVEMEIFNNYSALCRGDWDQGSTRSLSCYNKPATNRYFYWKTEYLHLEPDVIRYHEVITSNEIDAIISLARDQLKPSATLQEDGTVARETYRLSYSIWLDSPRVLIDRLEGRISELTDLNADTQESDSNSEHFQVNFYPPGGLYAAHYDLLGDMDLPTYIDHSGDRMATFMFYLNDVIAGGATVFPKLGLRVPAVKGSAIFWYNLHSDGSPDYDSLHAGCPVLFGNKWVLNKWIHERGQFRRRPCDLRPNID